MIIQKLSDGTYRQKPVGDANPIDANLSMLEKIVNRIQRSGKIKAGTSGGPFERSKRLEVVGRALKKAIASRNKRDAMKYFAESIRLIKSLEKAPFISEEYKASMTKMLNNMKIVEREIMKIQDAPPRQEFYNYGRVKAVLQDPSGKKYTQRMNFPTRPFSSEQRAKEATRQDIEQWIKERGNKSYGTNLKLVSFVKDARKPIPESSFPVIKNIAKTALSNLGKISSGSSRAAVKVNANGLLTALSKTPFNPGLYGGGLYKSLMKASDDDSLFSSLAQKLKKVFGY